MNFQTWINTQLAANGGAYGSKQDVIAHLVDVTTAAGEKVSRTTLASVAAGARLARLDKAGAISRATDGAVPVRELTREP